jgi:hypothetical protein
MGGGESRQLGQSLEALSLEERAKHYREFANEAFRRAAVSGTNELRAGYLSMAAGWHTLAIEMERVMHHVEHGKDDAGETARYPSGDG